MPIGESYQDYLKRKKQEQQDNSLSSSIEQLDKQINNAKARISDAGFNSDKEIDDRNAFERFTNLPKGQNFLFDTLELISRPGNAIRNFAQNTLINNKQDALTSLYKGISGKQKTTGSDLLKGVGITGNDALSKTIRGVGGFGVDVISDPTTYVPGAVFAKGAKSVLSPIGKGIKRGYQALEEASPTFKKINEETIKPFAQKTKDAFGRAFNSTYRYGDQLAADSEGNILINNTKDKTLKNIRDEAERSKQFLQEESIRQVAKAAKATGIDEGQNVGRVMENELEINRNAQELVGDILKGRSVRLNVSDGDPKELIQRMNNEILNSPEVKQAVRSTTNNVRRIEDELKKIQGINIDEVQNKINYGMQLTSIERNLYTDFTDANKSINLLSTQVNRLTKIRNDLIDNNRSTRSIDKQIFSRMKDIDKHKKTILKVTGKSYQTAIKKVSRNNLDNPLNDQEKKLLDNVKRLNDAKEKLNIKISNIQRGITFNTLDSNAQRLKNEGFEIINPMPRLYKKSTGNIKDFIQQISPKGTLEQVVKKDFQMQLKNVFDDLFKEGKVKTNLVKGSPELDELKRVLGNNIKVVSGKKGTTITLIQNDPNKMYYLLNQTKTEVPESLTNPVMQSGEDIFEQAIPENYPLLNKAGIFDEQRPESNFAGRIDTIEGKKYTAQDRIKAVELLRQNKSVNQELKDINKELVVLRKEEYESIRKFNASKNIRMSKSDLTNEVEKSLNNNPFYQAITKRLGVLEQSKQKTDDIVKLLRTETLNQSNLNIEDLQFTDLLKLIKFERPVRELSQSPIVNLAAKTFTDTNSWLLDYAKENGIEIQEIAGYMTHILSQEARKAKELAKGKPVSNGTFGPLQGNKNVVKQRKYEGSAEDINELMDKFVFETNAFFSTAIGQKRLIDYISAESAKRKILNNPNFAIKYQDGMTIPEGAQVISPDQFKFFRIDTPDGNKFLSLKKGEQYVVTRPVYDLLQRYQRAINDEGIRGVLKAVDTVTGTFKRLALFSPGYHVRNILGAMWNNYIGGMSAKEIGTYTSKAAEEVTNAVFKDFESKLYREYREEGLSANSLNKIDMAMPGKDPEDVIREVIDDQSKTLEQRINSRINPLKSSSWKNIFETSREAGDFFDQVNRFALYKWARESKKMTPASARNLVKAVQFDYSDLTNFEKEFMTRIFPFYRWSRNNIPFQMRKFVEEPQKFMKLYYSNQEAKKEAKIDDSKQPSYMRNSFNLPFGNSKEGTTFTANLPAEDLSKVSGLSEFGKMLVDSINPSLKLPIELVSNRNLFTNRPISDFEGQRSGLGLPMKTDYALQTLGGMPGRALSGFASKSESEQMNPQNSVSKLLGLPSRPYSQQKNEQIRKVQDLQKLRDLIDRIEQDTGDRPRKINDIKKGNGNQ